MKVQSQPSRLISFPLPREHGAWAMLTLSFIIGTSLGVASAPNRPWLPLALVAVSAFLAFSLREPLFRLIKRGYPLRSPLGRGIALAGFVTALCMLWLILAWRNTWLIPVVIVAGVGFAAALILRLRRLDRTVWGEAFAIFQVTAAAPLAFVVTAVHPGDPGMPGHGIVPVVLWALLVLYYTGPVFYVKMKFAQRKFSQPSIIQGLQIAWPNLAYHLVALIGLVLLQATQDLHTIVLLGYAPTLIKAVVGSVRVPAKLNLKRLGWMEVGLSTFFIFCVYLSLRP